MGKAEFKWTINSTEYHLQRKHIDLGAGLRSTKDVWELSVKIGDRWDAQWQQTSSRSTGATREEMIALLADMFDRKPHEVEALIVAAEKNAEDPEDSPQRRVSDAPDLGRSGLPTKPFQEQF